MENKMTKYVVYQVEFLADVDGFGPERVRCGQVGRFDTEAEAEDFMDRYYDYCEMDVEEV
jgi:hypothetical protein